MDRAYQTNVSATQTPIPYPGSFGFVQGSTDLSQFNPTSPGAFWFFYVTESIRNVIVAAGLTPDPQNVNQFYQALIILKG